MNVVRPRVIRFGVFEFNLNAENCRKTAAFTEKNAVEPVKTWKLPKRCLFASRSITFDAVAPGRPDIFRLDTFWVMAGEGIALRIPP